jgi:capsid protein
MSDDEYWSPAERKKRFLRDVLTPAFEQWLQEAIADGDIRIEIASKLSLRFTDSEAVLHFLTNRWH